MDRHKLEKIDFQTKLWLLIASLATIVVLGATALREGVFSDWRKLRARYSEILEKKATDEMGETAARHFDIRLVQNYVPQLGAVDRCQTCHTGLQDPRMVDEAQPFTTHPGNYLLIHDAEKFGCTVCHQGQGRATSVHGAHGRVPHWEHPLLEPQYAATACTKCHAEAELYGSEGLLARAGGASPGMAAAIVERGRDLFSERGCLGCHARDGVGGTMGPELSRVGEKTVHDFDFSHFHGQRRVDSWLREHFLQPAAVSGASLMPAIADAADAEALTAYMLSLRGHLPGFGDAAGSASNGAMVAGGRELYTDYCAACHGADGRGGDVPNIDVPSLNNADVLAVAGDEFYRFLIAKGRSGSHMPAWDTGGGNLSRDEIDLIVAYIRSWQATGASVADVSSRAGDPQSGRAYYRGLCAGCHGLEGEGGIGTALNTRLFLALADDAFLARSIIDGRPGTAMPAWKHLSAQAVSDILAHLRGWQETPPSFAEVEEARRNAGGDEVRIGGLLYGSRCRSCHGDAGEGRIGPSLASPEFLGAVDDRYLYRAIVEGRPSTAMPAWRHLSAADVGALIAFVRSWQQGGALDLAEAPRYGDFAAPPPGDYAAGRVHYEMACGPCHGERAIGGVGPQLANEVFLSSASDAQLFTWIAHGRTGTAMKGFLSEEQGPAELSPTQIADVIAYLRNVGASGELPVLRTGTGNASLGAALYSGSCASCHGDDGEGASGPQLDNPAFLRTASDGFLAATIVLGRPGTAMQPMVHGSEGLGQISPDNVADVIAFMRRWDVDDPWRLRRRVAEISDRAVSSGRDKYAAYCAGCHGPNGNGGRDGDGYYAPAINNEEFLTAASDGFLLATIARGRSETPMRPFGAGAGGIVSLHGDDINDIVAFIRSWQTNQNPIAGGKQ